MYFGQVPIPQTDSRSNRRNKYKETYGFKIEQ